MERIVDLINQVYEDSKNVGSVANAILNCKSHLDELVLIYKTQLTVEECFFLAFAIANGFENVEEPNLHGKTITKHLGSKGSDFLLAIPTFNQLFLKGIINRRSPGRVNKHSFNVRSAFDLVYYIGQKQLELAISGNIDLNEDKKYTSLDLYFRRIGQHFDAIADEDLSFDEFLNLTADIFLANDHLIINNLVLEFVSLSNDKKVTYKDVERAQGEEKEELIVEIMILLQLIRHSRDNSTVSLNELIERSMYHFAYVFDVSRKILNGEHLLFSGKYLVKDQDMELISEDGLYCFTKKFYKFFKVKDRLAINLDGDGDLQSYKSIKVQALFFNDDLQKQLDDLQAIIQPKRFKQTSNLLKSKYKKPGGISILLHGDPGTGKTEFVNQLAEATKRDIFKVDLSKMKSMWYGKSEQLVKNAFDEYKSICEDKPVIPIMFINEADGLLGKRLDVERSIDQTSNTIQNILLDEIEKLEGIFICTTNLIQNLDHAFDRRFLFKIKFDLPDKTVQAKLWDYYFNKQLSKNEIEKLTQQYFFSPAQIANIAHKVAIQEVLGEKISLEVIHKIGSAERLMKTSKKVGF